MSPQEISFPSPVVPSSPILTPVEAAAWLRSKTRTLERWRHEGKGPTFVRVGRHVGYRLEDLETWLARHTCSLDGPAIGPTVTRKGVS